MPCKSAAKKASSVKANAGAYPTSPPAKQQKGATSKDESPHADVAKTYNAKAGKSYLTPNQLRGMQKRAEKIAVKKAAKAARSERMKRMISERATKRAARQ